MQFSASQVCMQVKHAMRVPSSHLSKKVIITQHLRTSISKPRPN